MTLLSPDNTGNPFRRMVGSTKFWAAVVATVLALVPYVMTMTDKNLDRQAKAGATETFIVVVAGVWGVKIAAVAYEDGQAKSAPAQQVNVGARSAEQTVNAGGGVSGVGMGGSSQPPKLG